MTKNGQLYEAQKQANASDANAVELDENTYSNNAVIMDIVTSAQYPTQAGWKAWSKIGKE